MQAIQIKKYVINLERRKDRLDKFFKNCPITPVSDFTVVKAFDGKFMKYNLNSKYLIFSGIGSPTDFREILIENKFKITVQFWLKKSQIFLQNLYLNSRWKFKNT